MKKILYLEETVQNGCFIDNSTNTPVGPTLKLYYTISDENNIYYKYPKFDSIGRYDVIKNGDRIPLYIYLKEQQYFIEDYNYIIISTDLKILGIVDFPVKICENYFSIKIKKEVSNFIARVGFENVDIIPDLYGTTLLNLSSYPKLSGDGILMFLTSNTYSIRSIFNELRYKFIKRYINDITTKKVEKGITKVIDRNLYFFTYDLVDKMHVNEIIQMGSSDIITNADLTYCFSTEIVTDICSALMKNENRYLSYEKIYLEYLKLIFESDHYEKKIKHSKENFLEYGYINEYMKTKLGDDF